MAKNTQAQMWSKVAGLFAKIRKQTFHFSCSKVFMIADMIVYDANYKVESNHLLITNCNQNHDRQGNGCKNLISYLTEKVLMVPCVIKYGDSESNMGTLKFCFSITLLMTSSNVGKIVNTVINSCILAQICANRSYSKALIKSFRLMYQFS